MTARPALDHRSARCVLASLLVCGAASCASGCEPDLVVGDWGCLDVATTLHEGPITVPWSTSFETGFCDYARVRGFCYAGGEASYTLVNSPVHSGDWAVAFTVDTTDSSAHARCVIEGQFPSTGSYSAWYLIPDAPINSGNWNLFFFRGGDLTMGHNLWDVSVESTDELEPRLYIYDQLEDGLGIQKAEDPPLIPIGDWFRIEFYWKRADDRTGEVALYQDGELVFEFTGLRTDDTNWAQWYVGNLANRLMPRVSTVYVDDVEIRETR
ncbi:MAG: polysaccharide lyase [Myxococcota bacterium]|nr:polysaccharide lyase [Myxococcota bacterium]